MTSSIPDSFSTSDLESLLDSAPKEQEIKEPTPTFNNYEQQLEDAANEGLSLMCEKIDDPLVHKVATLRVANNMAAWHTKVGEAAMERGDTDCGTAWLRDAGKWQAVMDIILSIGLGDKDTYLIGHD